MGHLLKKIASTVNIIGGLEFRGLFKKKVVGTFLLFLGEVRLGYMAGGQVPTVSHVRGPSAVTLFIIIS